MDKKRVFKIFISCFLLSVLPVYSALSQFVSSYEEFDKFDGIASSAVYISVPFHYQINNYYCGPASLEMVFDYYGEDIPQAEIADVARTYPWATFADELRRAAHFSNLSTSLGDEMNGSVTGYSARKIGYAAFERGGLTVDDLKYAVDNGEPVIVLMWMTVGHGVGHFRVVIGYDETEEVMHTHDPWYGANQSWTYPMFLDLWEYSGNWGLWVHPWNVELHTPRTVNEGDDFEVTANITYPCSAPFNTGYYSASACNATIELPDGLEFTSGETAQKALGNMFAGESAQTSWLLHANKTGSYNISVAATGVIEGSVWEHDHYPSYDYEDAIGGISVYSITINSQIPRVHNHDTGLNYTSIQEAINANETLDGHTIFIEKGIYNENVVVNKALALVGENREATIIEGKGNEDAVTIISNGTSLSNFTLQAPGFMSHALRLEDVSGVKIADNILTNSFSSLLLVFSDFNTIRSNNIAPGSYYSVFHNSSYNTLTGNSIGGLRFSESINNTLSGNTIEALWLDFSSNNSIFHNNFINAVVDSYKSANTWDDGYPSGGNYWSNYTGIDSDYDGVGDNPHELDPDNIDHYPLMGMFSSFNPSLGKYVNVVSNSTIESIEYLQDNASIRMHVSNMTEDQIHGFCRVCIPTDLIAPNYTVTIRSNGDLVNVLYFNNTLHDNGTHRWIYFAYEHSTLEIVIIPEFPSLLILTLFAITTLIAAFVYRKKRLVT